MTACNVATKLAVGTSPLLRNARFTVTVSPGSTAPFGGLMLSDVNVARAATISTERFLTTVTACAVLFAAFGSGIPPELTLARLVIDPATVGALTVIVTVAFAPLAMLPKLALTMPPALAAVPCVVLTERNVVPAGNVLVTFTPVAVEGPLLVSARV